MNKIIAETFFDTTKLKNDEKTIAVILSEETKVLRYNWEDGAYDLILDHSSASVDLNRKDILPVLLQHDTNMLPIGKYENVRLEDGKLKAIAKFDINDELAMKVFGKLERGFMQSLSVGINITKTVLEDAVNENGRKTYRATKWEITEASIVTIPAIAGARVGLSLDEVTNLATMPSDTEKIVNSKKGNSMEFNKENFKVLGEQVKVLNANRETLSTRSETLKIQLEDANSALDAIKSNLSEAEAKVREVETRVREAMSEGVSIDVAIAMLNANTAEDASRLAIDAKKTIGAAAKLEENGNNDAKAKEELEIAMAVAKKLSIRRG